MAGGGWESYAKLLRESAARRSLARGTHLHATLLKRGLAANLFLANHVLHMYCNCGALPEARRAFDTMASRDVSSWNTLMAGYARHGRLREARTLFHRMPHRDAVSWNIAIAASADAEHGDLYNALKDFARMRAHGSPPTPATLCSLLCACAGAGAGAGAVSARLLRMGLPLHGIAIRERLQHDVGVATALVHFYGRCGALPESHRVFAAMAHRNLASWNAMLGALSHNHAALHALHLFLRMRLAGLLPDDSTFSCVLSACSYMTALEVGRQVQGCIIKSGFERNVFVGSALVDVYAKCGCIKEARKMFDQLPERNTVTWSSIILCYAQNGLGEHALQLFAEMCKGQTSPDHVTFMGVLTACKNARLVEEGCRYFSSMVRDYHIKPDVDHYACMVDLLGWAGHLEEAEQLIESMPDEPDAAIWGALLGACQRHGNARLAEKATSSLSKIGLGLRNTPDVPGLELQFVTLSLPHQTGFTCSDASKNTEIESEATMHDFNVLTQGEESVFVFVLISTLLAA